VGDVGNGGVIFKFLELWRGFDVKFKYIVKSTLCIL
jgi:hypothetical protein